jgi:hypothetical protein
MVAAPHHAAPMAQEIALSPHHFGHSITTDHEAKHPHLHHHQHGIIPFAPPLAPPLPTI